MLIAAALLAAVLLPLGVQAQSPPHVFVGEAALDGAPVPDGTVIQAVVSGKALPGAETAVRGGKFTLIVEQPDEVGGEETPVSFAVGEYLARQSYQWQLGEITIVTLEAFSVLPVISAEIPPPPERLVRGDRFFLSVRADTGFYQATRGEVEVGLDLQVFALDQPGEPPLPVRMEKTLVEAGRVTRGWSYPAPTSTATHSGELFSLPLQVRDTAPTGTTSLTVQVQLSGPDGLAFTLEPEDFTFEIAIVGQESDLNEDGAVDFADLAVLGSVWGKQQGEPGFHPDFDLDGDGSIWIGDLLILLQSYGVAAQSA